MKAKSTAQRNAQKKPRQSNDRNDQVTACIHNALVEIVQCNVSRKQLKPCMASYHLNIAMLELQKAKLIMLNAAGIPICHMV